MKKIAEFIIKSRYIIFAVFTGLVVLSFFLIPKVSVNYDLTKYLKKTEVLKSLEIMNSEFGSSTSAQIMVEDIDINTARRIKTELEGIEGVTAVIFDEANNYKDNCALISVFLSTGSYEDKTFEIIDEIRNIGDYKISLNGEAVKSSFLQRAVKDDMRVILIISVIIIFMILMLTSTSWIDPLVFFIVLGFSIIISLGMNALFENISFVTNSICIILQLALSMDYSIIMLHRFNEEKASGIDSKKAAVNALIKTFSPISSSSLTTIAGLAALAFMRFTLGFDIGIVLIKGVFISLITVILLMPGILILMSKPLEKTKHRSIFEITKLKLQKSYNKRADKEISFDNETNSLHNFQPDGSTQSTISDIVDKNEPVLPKKKPKMRGFAGFQLKTRFIIPIALIVIILISVSIQNKLQFSYIAEPSKNPNASINVENDKIESKFGISNSIAVLLPKSEGNRQQEIIDYMLEYRIDGEKITTSAQGIVTTGLYDYFTAAEISELFGISETLVDKIYEAAGVAEGGSIMLLDLSAFFESAEFRAIEQTLTEGMTTAEKLMILLKLSKAKEEAAIALKMFESENYFRLVFNISLPLSSENAYTVINDLKAKAKTISADSHVVSESATFGEIKDLFTVDSVVINLISFFAVFLIILFTFKSLSIPVLLTALIQGAIWITMAVNVITASPVYFICYLVIMCIQMGATVDYAILMTSRYLEYRKTFSKEDSIAKAFEASLPTILTSGSILVIAALIVGLASSVTLISTLGLILSRGCFVSLVCIAFALPQILYLSDGLIRKTTLKSDPKNTGKDIKKHSIETENNFEKLLKETENDIKE